MFTGEHPRLLDAASRVNLPKDWRSLKITEFYLISGSADSFIMAMPRSEYEAKVAEIMNPENKLSPAERNKHLRSLGAQCVKVKLDSAGRLTLPAGLCKDINIAPPPPDAKPASDDDAKGTPVLLIGAVTTIEIWNPEGYEKWKRKQSEPGVNGETPMNVKEFLGV